MISGRELLHTPTRLRFCLAFMERSQESGLETLSQAISVAKELLEERKKE